MGAFERVERVIDNFPLRQTMSGFFHSQDGEWDSNGEVLWLIERFCKYTGRTAKKQWHNIVIKGAHWILNKRTSDDLPYPHAGLLPAGFS